MDTLAIPVIFIFLAFGAACLEHAFQEYMDENMIFYWYAKILFRLKRRNEFWFYITKPLGLCRYCNGVWVSIIVFFNVYGLRTPWTFVFLFIGVNFLFLKILLKYVR